MQAMLACRVATIESSDHPKPAVFWTSSIASSPRTADLGLPDSYPYSRTLAEILKNISKLTYANP
jgi:hypothetical protein